MSTPTAPGDRAGNDAAGIGRKRRIATATGAAAVLAAALAATACAATPTGNSTQASLNGSAQQIVAASPSGGTPSADAPMTTATASMPPAMRSKAPSHSAAPNPGHRAKSSGPATWPASSGPATSSAGSPAPSAPATWAAPSTPPPSAPSTGAAPSQPAVSGSPNQALSVSRDCAAQMTVQVEQQFSCSFTRSGGDPDILYAVNLFVNGQLSLTAGSTPAGLVFTGTNDDQVFTIGGKPQQWGTFAFTVQDYAGTTSASANFTLIVPEPPASQRLP